MNIWLAGVIVEVSRMRRRIGKNERFAFSKATLILIGMYIVTVSIWIFALMPGIGFESFITNYPIPLTMVLGGFLSGFTICGGGAVSFPVFSKLLEFDPLMARDFALGIQSFGMTCASITIIVKKIVIEKNVVIFCSAGSFFGLIIGNIFILPWISSKDMKILFSILTAAFGMSLLFKNYFWKDNVKNISDQLVQGKKRSVAGLLLIGFSGGIFTAILGTGADIIAFSIITILYNVNEKILNPSSDMIMAFSSIMGLLMRLLFFGGIHPQAAVSFPLAIPIVIVMAPLGAIMANKIRRITIVNFLLFFILIDIISTFNTVKLNGEEIVSAVMVFCLCFGFYLFLLKLAIKRRKKEL
jgi:uncharacterized membrane protein YfcA